MTESTERNRYFLERLKLDGVEVPEGSLADLMIEFQLMGAHIDRVNASTELLSEPSTVQRISPFGETL
jgi:hypothetical protein